MELFGIEEESVRVGNSGCGSGDSSIAVALAAVPVFFLVGQGLAYISATRRVYEEYCDLLVNPEPVSGTDLNNIFDQDMLSAKARDAEDLSEESFRSTAVPIKKVGCARLVSEKGYVDRFQRFTREV